MFKLRMLKTFHVFFLFLYLFFFGGRSSLPKQGKATSNSQAFYAEKSKGTKPSSQKSGTTTSVIGANQSGSEGGRHAHHHGNALNCLFFLRVFLFWRVGSCPRHARHQAWSTLIIRSFLMPVEACSRYVFSHVPGWIERYAKVGGGFALRAWRVLRRQWLTARSPRSPAVALLWTGFISGSLDHVSFE